MVYEVEFTDEFREWWDGLRAEEQNKIAKTVLLLEEHGPGLGDPHSSAIYGSRHRHMRELRVQHEGRPYRILYAFDPRRIAILLIGGDKTGDKRWYASFIQVADDLYDQHLREIREEK
ncbi:MAG TPA: type II toxin-antitoxin system RelE/ParE family toxin [Longimicrobium sp.]